MDTPGYTFREDNFVKIGLPPFCDGVCSKKNEFAPRRSKFFPFRVDPFQKGLGVQKNEQEVRNVASLAGNGGNLKSSWVI